MELAREGREDASVRGEGKSRIRGFVAVQPSKAFLVTMGYSRKSSESTAGRQRSKKLNSRSASAVASSRWKAAPCEPSSAALLLVFSLAAVRVAVRRRRALRWYQLCRQTPRTTTMTVMGGTDIQNMSCQK